MLQLKWLMLHQLKAGVLLEVDQEFLTAIRAVFSNWDFDLSDQAPEETFASVRKIGGKYTISSPFMDEPEIFGDPLNTLCRLVVEAAWAQLRERQDMLCLHGAAVRINGRLMVFPSTRRAGKSTLTLGLMAAGVQVFSDDFLPLVVDKSQLLCGFAQGISPRLRIPLPEPFAAQSKEYLEQHEYIQNRQYRYVVPKPTEAAAFGTLAPIGALIFLDRTPGATPAMTEIAPAEALKTLIKQNFSRAMNASAILGMLAEIVENTPAFRLAYSDIPATVDLIQNRFCDWVDDPVRIKEHDYTPAPEPSNESEIQSLHSEKLMQNPGVTDRCVGDQQFLSGRSDRDIIHLNPVAAGIWQLLAQPVTLADISETLQAAFPLQDPAQLHGDACATLKAFDAAGIICPAGATPNRQDSCAGQVGVVL